MTAPDPPPLTVPEAVDRGRLRAEGERLRADVLMGALKPYLSHHVDCPDATTPLRPHPICGWPGTCACRLFDHFTALAALGDRAAPVAERPGSWLESGARKLVTEVWRLVAAGKLNARSRAADAALDVRDLIDSGWDPLEGEPPADRSVDALIAEFGSAPVAEDGGRDRVNSWRGAVTGSLVVDEGIGFLIDEIDRLSDGAAPVAEDGREGLSAEERTDVTNARARSAAYSIADDRRRSAGESLFDHSLRKLLAIIDRLAPTP